MATTESLLEDSRKVRLLDWLTTPPSERQPQSQNKLAEELGVSARLLRMWKAEPTFRALWEKQAKEIIGEPDKVQRLLEQMYEGATNPEETLASRVRAADLYLKAVDGIRPPAVDAAAKTAREMSDAELEALIAQEAQRERARRQAETVDG